MKPKSRLESSQLQLFQAQFEQLLNPDHPLFVLAGQLDWARFEAALADCYSPDQGAPAKGVRLLVGLHYLKHALNESDESLVERWVENPYWQHFCGFETMQHELPLHPTPLTKWRQRVDTIIKARPPCISLSVAPRSFLAPRKSVASDAVPSSPRLAASKATTECGVAFSKVSLATPSTRFSLLPDPIFRNCCVRLVLR